jgi:5-methylcytosine-specific restriction endonuclease McrA
MRDFFLELWKKRVHKSEVSGSYLGSEPLTVFFHHILPKSKYPESGLDEENIILLTMEEHDQVEMDPTRYEEVNKRRELLKQKYEIH